MEESPDSRFLFIESLSLLREKVREEPLRSLWERLRTEAMAVARSIEALPESVSNEELRSSLEACAAHTLLSGDFASGQVAWRLFERLTASSSLSDLNRAAQLLEAVLTYDACAGVWTKEQTALARSRIRDWAFSMSRIGEGNPDNPFNNWWGVTHSAGVLGAFLLREGDPQMEQLYEEEAAKVSSYLGNYGENGHYYEGTGYGGYAFFFWGTAVLALRRTTGRDLLALNPGAGNYGWLHYILTVARPTVSDSDHGNPAKRLGMRVFWNDDGGTFSSSLLAALSFGFADPDQLPGMRWQFDRLSGTQGDGSYLEPSSHGFGRLMLLCLYPQDVTARSPRPSPSKVPESSNDPVASPWPLCTVDYRTGLAVFRSRYQDADDCIFAVYAKSYHGGGHNHDDAGSWRFCGLGHGWSQAGGQAKFGPEFQSVLLKNGSQIQPQGRPGCGHGQISYLQALPGGSGAVSMRLSTLYQARLVDRHFAIDYQQDTDTPALLANLDVLWNDSECEWGWGMCWERNLEAHLDAKRRVLKLTAPGSRACFELHFLEPENLSFELKVSPPTSRTFSGGAVRHYPGVPYLLARTRAARAYFWVAGILSTSSGHELRTTGSGYGRTVEIGQRIIRCHQSRWFQGPLLIQSGSPRMSGQSQQ